MEEHSPSSCQSPLLIPYANLADDGSLDLNERPLSKTQTGGWKASLFLIGVGFANSIAYCAIGLNLVNYLTNGLHESPATAAMTVNIWTGVASIFPMVGAFLADSYWGRYWTTLVCSVIFFQGLVWLNLSVTLPFLRPTPCNRTLTTCPKATPIRTTIFFFCLYTTAIGFGGQLPCLEAFGADQFDDEDPEERKDKRQLWMGNGISHSICGCGTLPLGSIEHLISEDSRMSSIQFKSLGAICPYRVGGLYASIRSSSDFLALIGALYIELDGADWEQIARCPPKTFNDKGKPFATLKNSSTNLHDRVVRSSIQMFNLCTHRFLDKATVKDDIDSDNKTAHSWRLCTVTQVEEVKLILRLFPIWVVCLMHGVVYAQSSTFFTKQGSTMDRNIGPYFEIPAATLQSFTSVFILLLVPVYDCVFVPLARNLTGDERGITMLQRIGIGMFCCILSMIVAALTEMKRLKAARDNGLVDKPHTTIPLSIFWLLPQYILFGISDVFTLVGLQEYFYDQMPDTMRSLGVAVYRSVFGIGSFMSSILISITEELSSIRGKEQSWFAENLNRAHLDYFYWLLASLGALNLCITFPLPTPIFIRK
eukprot:Gb_21687 [translate_table: standard]